MRSSSSAFSVIAGGDLLGLFHHLVVVGKALFLGRDPCPANDTFVVDDEDRPAGDAGIPLDVIASYAVISDHLPLEVSDQVEGQPAKLFGERLVRVDRVHADAIDPDAAGDGFVVLGPKLGQLGPSTTCEIQHIEKEDEGAVLL